MGLQREITKVLDGRRGAIVAIEPPLLVTCLLSSPILAFDPNLFVDGIDQETWDELNNDEDKPLLNRALRGAYPIGSTIKPFWHFLPHSWVLEIQPGYSRPWYFPARQPYFPGFYPWKRLRSCGYEEIDCGLP